MSRWWRAYEDALHDPKVQRLPPHLFKTWFNLLCIASKYDGRLPTADEMAFLLRRRVDDVRRDVADLCARRLFDALEDKIVPHNWDTRQYKSDLSTQRVSKHRKRFSNGEGNVSGNVSETPPETETETETDSKKEPELRSDDWPKDFRDQFWSAYPHKVGKPDALAKLDRARKHGVVFADVMAGLSRYVAKTDDRPWCNPATWINQQRWTDQPAAQTQRGPPGRALTARERSREDMSQFFQEALHGRPDQPAPDAQLRRDVVGAIPARSAGQPDDLPAIAGGDVRRIP